MADSNIGTQTPARPRGRRFQSTLCQFHTIGFVTRAPEYARTRRDQARATLALTTGDDRILELVVLDRDETTLKTRLAGCTPGAMVFAQGTVRAPHANRQELPQFYAELIFRTAPNGGTPTISPPTLNSRREASA